MMNGRMLAVIAGLLVGLPCASLAQTTTGSVRGYVSDSTGAPLAGATVQVSSSVTGVQRTTTSDPHGFYALLGLTPGTYTLEVRRIGFAPQSHPVDVPVGTVLSADFRLTENPIQLAGISVTAAGQGIETRTSEVATNVTQQQIQNLPTPSGNFLNLAALQPGVTITPDLIGAGVNDIPSRSFSSAGQGPGSVNVFIDGASTKNDLTGGEGSASGVSGQDASRGNPFPLNAIDQYRVIAQNFKAEYQRSSSAIITAVTKSGGTTWSGDASLSYIDKSFVALNGLETQQRASNPSGFSVPAYSRYLVDLSAGGPLTADKRLRFFGSYEGNYQHRANSVDITPVSGYSALDSVNLTGYNGNFSAPFHETMLFGKLNYTLNSQQSLELSLNTRDETNLTQFGGGNSFQNATNYRNLTTLGVLKHTWATANGLNEATVSYTRFQRNPTPDNPGLPTRVFGVPGGATLGSNCCSQNFTQNDIGLRDDYTYTGFHGGGDHVFKFGVNLDLMSWTVNKENQSNPTFYYDSVQVRNSVTERFNFQTPDQLVWSPVVNPFVNTSDTQLGLYAQDDWSPSQQLTLNLGVRWDYETNMLNTHYVTPQDVIDTVTKYDSQLQHPIDPGTYFTDGNQRKPFLGAIQPRLGFSYALDKQNQTTLFGGWGIFYDRNYFDMAVDEDLKLTNPTYTVLFAPQGQAPSAGEVPWSNTYLTTNPAVLTPLVTGGQASGKEAWLIANNVKPPKTYQWNLGVRHVFFGDVLTSVTYAGARGVDGLTLNWANFGLNPNGSCCTGGSPFHGFSNIIYSTNSVKTWYDALEVQIDRSYRRTGRIGWGAGIAYTYALREVQGVDNLGDEFAFPYTGAIPKHPLNDEKSHVVVNWVTDVPYAWGIKFSGLITLGTGPRYDIGSRFNLGAAPPNNVYIPGGFTPPHYSFIIPKAWAYRDVDVRLEKDFPSVNGNMVGVTLDVFNVFNYKNYGYNVSNTGVGTVNYGVPFSDPRYIQLGATYHF
jgi:Carboxypeptidase regulatory-like domain/TonB dependent receptor-like, beta-barrel